jgi:hypothetical protein
MTQPCQFRPILARLLCTRQPTTKGAFERKLALAQHNSGSEF